jgi:hypothetical protein
LGKYCIHNGLSKLQKWTKKGPWSFRNSVFFTGKISLEGEFFLPLAYFWQNLDPEKTFLSPKIHPFSPFFIHLNPFSSTFRAFIQHPDELASGYVLVVPPGRKTKNHRKNTV